MTLQEIDEIFKIFQHLGTPNEQVWPGMMRECPDFKTDFPRWQPKSFQQVKSLARSLRHVSRVVKHVVCRYRRSGCLLLSDARDAAPFRKYPFLLGMGFCCS